MANERDLAWMSLYAYAANDDNSPLLLSPWQVIQDRTEGTLGFAYAVYRHSGSGEVVVAYRGSDDLSTDFLTNTGLVMSQERQAAVVAARIIEQYGAANVTFTGHSLGGGLAATQAVWFNRPSVVFDPAPTQAIATDLAAVNSVMGSRTRCAAPRSRRIQNHSKQSPFDARYGLILFKRCLKGWL